MLSHAFQLYISSEGIETLYAELLTIPCMLEVAWKRKLLPVMLSGI